jgi:hypothetical protein
MDTQLDWKVRVIAPANLEAMLVRVNDEGGTFCIDRMSQQNVTISVNVPDDEYGGSHNVVAKFPILKLRGMAVGRFTPCIVLGTEWVGQVTGLRDDDPDLYQLFMPLLDCPTLWRSPTGEWGTEEEWNARKEEGVVAP